MRIGSLFSGAGGLDMAVEAVFGGTVVWHSEIDKAASKVLAHRFPDVPNLGDITEINWDNWKPMLEVDILCGGFPCQDVSSAGKQAGIKDGTRSGLWSVFAEAIDILRPPIVIIENVRGLLSAQAHRNVESEDPVVGDGERRPVLRAAGAVFGDLSDIGYDAAWTTLAAGDIGAPHRRERVFIVAQSCSSAVGINTGRTSGAEAGAHPGDRLGDHRAERADVALFPTPSACNANDGEGTETWLARREVVKARVKNGNGMGMPLAIAVKLLPTPTTQDGANNGGPSQFERNTLPLNAEVMLLPTPRSSDCFGAGLHGDGGMDLRTTVTLLPTPAAQDGNGGGRYSSPGHQSTLPGEVRLLPSPRAIDGNDGGGPAASAYKIGTGQAALSQECKALDGTQWGKYEPAIRRWENLTRPAPPPTEPNKNGNPRLAAAFSEWLMGWPEGWVTDPAIGISRNEQLKIVGNGVCPQQAAAALRYLLEVTK
jgi:DNA (cytosine-5)-methyltransferase 1